MRRASSFRLHKCEIISMYFIKFTKIHTNKNINTFMTMKCLNNNYHPLETCYHQGNYN